MTQIPTCEQLDPIEADQRAIEYSLGWIDHQEHALDRYDHKLANVYRSLRPSMQLSWCKFMICFMALSKIEEKYLIEADEKACNMAKELVNKLQLEDLPND